MKKTLSSTLAMGAFVLLFAWSGCSKGSGSSYSSSPTSPSAPAPLPNTVSMSGMAFSPATLTINAGTTVTWKNDDGIVHTSTSDTGIWDTGDIPAHSSATTTFNTPGTYPYNCKYHASMGMRGSVIVK